MSWESDILRKFRNERDMTQAQFAEWLEIPKRTYEKWESGERVPPQWVISLIKFKCENCYHYEFEEDEYGNRYHYCRYFDCQLNEIAGLNDCENYDQMSTWGRYER